MSPTTKATATARTKSQQAGTCPICGGSYNFLGQHTRNAHGKGLRELGLAKRGGPKSRGRANGTEPITPAARAVVEDLLTEVNGKGEFSELRQFKVLQDKRGGVWLAERIR
jgi:hypothetical protein